MTQSDSSAPGTGRETPHLLRVGLVGCGYQGTVLATAMGRLPPAQAEDLINGLQALINQAAAEAPRKEKT